MKRRKGRTWVETDVEEMLGLSPADLVIVEFRAVLAVALQQARKRKKLTPEAAAKRIGTSQAQVSKMEGGQSSITIDRLIKALAALGVSRPTILKALNSAA
jgi:DNA-binding XRE family transcriptional regulator